VIAHLNLAASYRLEPHRVAASTIQSAVRRF
jgi:hypothetical protein